MEPSYQSYFIQMLRLRKIWTILLNWNERVRRKADRKACQGRVRIFPERTVICGSYGSKTTISSNSTTTRILTTKIEFRDTRVPIDSSRWAIQISRAPDDPKNLIPFSARQTFQSLGGPDRHNEGKSRKLAENDNKDIMSLLKIEDHQGLCSQSKLHKGRINSTVPASSLPFRTMHSILMYLSFS